MGKYVVGFGQFKSDFTIEEKETASFLSQKDAEEFIRMKGFEYMSHRVFYMDVHEEGKEPLRLLFNRETGELLSSDEVKRRGVIEVDGYRVTAVEEFEEDGGYDFSTEESVCLFYDDATRIKMEYISEGYTEVSIDEDNISIKDFRGSENFINGSGTCQEKTKMDDAMATYKKYNHPGASFGEMIGKALEAVDTSDMIRYFRENVMGGESLIRNYVENQIISNEINKDRFRNEERER